MKITLLMTLLFGLIFISAVGAAEKTPTPQQQRMTDCNQQASAKMLKGEERKTFMSQCLKKETTTSQGKALTPQQQKMSDCSKAATAKSLKGDERSTFMSSCLKKACKKGSARAPLFFNLSGLEARRLSFRSGSVSLIFPYTG